MDLSIDKSTKLWGGRVFGGADRLTIMAHYARPEDTSLKIGEREEKGPFRMGQQWHRGKQA